uniref:Predicted protein n=1 Tax=Hordeum vulgare subsp. vulgare TaxID=112509 RepID=F2EKZ9_HORVV|nr:predicted protein [Hordeum vulgare subsp. vulgare]
MSGPARQRRPCQPRRMAATQRNTRCRRRASQGATWIRYHLSFHTATTAFSHPLESHIGVHVSHMSIVFFNSAKYVLLHSLSSSPGSGIHYQIPRLPTNLSCTLLFFYYIFITSI